MSLHAKMFPTSLTTDQILTLSNILSQLEDVLPRISAYYENEDPIHNLHLSQSLKDFNFYLSGSYNSKTLYPSYAIQALILKLSYVYELVRIEISKSEFVLIITLKNIIDRLKAVYKNTLSQFMDVC